MLLKPEEHEEAVTVTYAMHGEPSEKVPKDALCCVCENKFSDHTLEMHRECVAKVRPK